MGYGVVGMTVESHGLGGRRTGVAQLGVGDLSGTCGEFQCLGE
jgi:hypothetical protein